MGRTWPATLQSQCGAWRKSIIWRCLSNLRGYLVVVLFWISEAKKVHDNLQVDQRWESQSSNQISIARLNVNHDGEWVCPFRPLSQAWQKQISPFLALYNECNPVTLKYLYQRYHIPSMNDMKISSYHYPLSSSSLARALFLWTRQW